MTHTVLKEQSSNQDLLISELRRDEGCVPHMYLDSLGYATVGVGRLIDRRKGGRLSDDEIDYLLANDLRRVEAELDRYAAWWRELDPVRSRVLMNMAFQLGIRGLLKFKNTLAAVKAERWDDAANGMLASLWARQTPERAKRLAKMMRTGSV